MVTSKNAVSGCDDSKMNLLENLPSAHHHFVHCQLSNFDKE